MNIPLPRSTHLRPRRSSIRPAALAVSLLVLSACASTSNVPDQALQAADQAIENAEQTRVAGYASPELSEAREKLVAAHHAVTRREMVLAERLAKESRVDAELASAKIQVAKAREINDEMQKSTNALKQEMRRNTGESS